jgi:alpha-D-ribose 1-methylphosphonate 5-triphosphate diphosphatase
MSYTILNGQVLTATGELADAPVQIEGGRLASVGGATSPRGTVLDATGLLVLPGIIDLHGDGFERSLMPRPGVFFDHEVALAETDRILIAQGITTAYMGLTVSWEPGLRCLAAGETTVAALKRLRSGLACDVRLQIRWETFALDAVETVAAWLDDEPRPILAFNDHTTQSLEKRTDAKKIQNWAERSGLTKDEYVTLLERVAHQADRVPAAIAFLAGRARTLGVTMLSHDDRLVENRHYYRGLGATVCEFPLTRAAIEDARSQSEHTVLGAPNILRGGSHTGALTATDMIGERLCTVLASDYYYPSQLAAVFKLTRAFGYALPQVWPLVSTNAADAAGLRDRGRIQAGQRADLILVDPDGPAGPQVVATLVAGRLCHLSRDILKPGN